MARGAGRDAWRTNRWAQAAVAPEDAARLFPEARKHVLVLVTELQRLRDMADALPHAVAAAQEHAPTRSSSFTADLIDHHARASSGST